MKQQYGYMNNTYLNLSTKIEKEILAILKAVNSIARDLGLDFFVFGATARDIIFKYGYNIPAGRATQDIDLAVNLRTWDQYDQFCKELCEKAKFRSTKTIHRFEYDNYPVDIIPFGAISDKSKNILWPPDKKTTMKLTGFEEAYKNSILVLVNEKPRLEIPIVSPTGFALLKLLSWSDGENRNYKDAYDLNLVIRYYDSLGNEDRIYEFDSILNQDEFE
jgi:predicted nucleotidyltransferase